MIAAGFDGGAPKKREQQPAAQQRAPQGNPSDHQKRPGQPAQAPRESSDVPKAGPMPSPRPMAPRPADDDLDVPDFMK